MEDFYSIWSTHDNNMVDNMMAMLWQYNDNTDDNSDNGWSELVGRVTQQRGRQYPPNAFTSDAQSAPTFVRTTTFINPLFSKSSAQNIFTPDKVGPTHIKYYHTYLFEILNLQCIVEQNLVITTFTSLYLYLYCWAASGHYCFDSFVPAYLMAVPAMGAWRE